MAELDRFADALLEAAPDAVIVTDPEGRVVRVNAQAEALLGYRRDELQGQDVQSLIPEARRGQASPWLLRGMGRLAVELRAHRRDGATVPVEVTLAPVRIEAQAYTIAVMRDLTARLALEAQLRYRSTHDPLTGLDNRTAFEDARRRLDELGPHPVGVMMVDLDDLKRINDQHGHAVGDTMLRRAAGVLRATFRASDVVARIGGDEFAILAAGRDSRALDRLAARLHAAVEAHNSEVTGAPLRLSIGMALAEAGIPVAAALQKADERMYSMKRAHHGG